LKKGRPKFSVGQLRQMPEEAKVRLDPTKSTPCSALRSSSATRAPQVFPDGVGKTQSIFRERQVSDWENRCDTVRDLSLQA
jgi:hypothetical protein